MLIDCLEAVHRRIVHPPCGLWTYNVAAPWEHDGEPSVAKHRVILCVLSHRSVSQRGMQHQLQSLRRRACVSCHVMPCHELCGRNKSLDSGSIAPGKTLGKCLCCSLRDYNDVRVDISRTASRRKSYPLGAATGFPVLSIMCGKERTGRTWEQKTT